MFINTNLDQISVSGSGVLCGPTMMIGSSATGRSRIASLLNLAMRCCGNSKLRATKLVKLAFGVAKNVCYSNVAVTSIACLMVTTEINGREYYIVNGCTYCLLKCINCNDPAVTARTERFANELYNSNKQNTVFKYFVNQSKDIGKIDFCYIEDDVNGLVDFTDDTFVLCCENFQSIYNSYNLSAISWVCVYNVLYRNGLYVGSFREMRDKIASLCGRFINNNVVKSLPAAANINKQKQYNYFVKYSTSEWSFDDYMKSTSNFSNNKFNKYIKPRTEFKNVLADFLNYDELV